MSLPYDISAMKRNGIVSKLAEHRLLILVVSIICLFFLSLTANIKIQKEKGGKVFEIPGSEIIFRLVETGNDCRILDIYNDGRKNDTGKNRISINEAIPWRSMIYVSTSSPDSVFVDRNIGIVSTSSVRIEEITPQVESRARNYVRIWFGPMENRMYRATGKGDYCGIEPKKSILIDFLIYFFVALLLICGIFFRLIYHVDAPEEPSAVMPEDIAADGNRIIRVDNMQSSFLDKVLKEFMKAYKLHDIVENIDGTDDRHFLKISSSVGFYTFSLLINFLTYSEKNRRYAVTGWYEVGKYRTDNKNHSFSNKTLMFYIPESDEEYDNAYFVTPEGAHYKQSFGNPTVLRVVKSQTREYEAL